MIKELVHLKYFDSDKRLKAEIQEDPFVGFYLYIYDTKSGDCIRDELQDDLETVMRRAEVNHQMMRHAWVKSD